MIPLPAWIVAGSLFLLGLCLLFAAAVEQGRHAEPLIIFSIAAFLPGGYTLLVGYVYADAKRRGMRHVLWMWLAILVPNGIGIIRISSCASHCRHSVPPAAARRSKASHSVPGAAPVSHPLARNAAGYSSQVGPTAPTAA